MQLIRNILFKRKTVLPVVLILLALMYCFKPGHALAFDKDWDAGHTTTDVEDPDPTDLPDDDTGGDGDDDDGDDEDDGDDGDDDEDDDEDPEEPDEDEDEDDEEDKDDDCKEDCNNECKPDAKKSPVYVKSGNLELKYTDFEIAGIGPALGVVRSYNSHDKYNGPFGHGWAFNLIVRLIRVSDHNNDYIIIRKPSGKRLKFIKTMDGTYFPTAASVTDTLVENQDGSFTLNCKTCSRTYLRPTYHFNIQGNLAYMSDNQDNRINFTYDTSGRLISASSSVTKRSLTIAYGENDKISQITNSLGRSWRYAYDAQDNLITVTDPLNYSLNYEYSPKHKLLSVTDKNGNQSPVITYDEKSRVKTYGRGREIYTYAYFSGYTTKTDPLGNMFTFYYDQNGNVIKTILPDGSEVLAYIDANVHPTKRVDANGNEWQYTYNESGQILTETDPLGHTTTYTYDPEFQKIKTKTDPRGAKWTYTYDTDGNLIKVVDPLLCETLFTRNARGQVLTKTDGAGNTFTYAYDAAGNLIQVTDPLGNVETSSYDGLGRLISETDARGNTRTYTYDILGRLTDAKDPAGNHRYLTYDGNGNKTSVTDENGNTTTYGYDISNRMITKTDALGNLTSYVYDAAGHLNFVTDARGNTTGKTRDKRYNITSETDQDGNVTTYTYDASGNRLTKTDARGNTWTYTYDAMDRLLTETDPLDSITAYEYDETGNKVKIIDPEGKITYFTYNLVGSLTRSLVKIGDTLPEPDADDIVTTYTYDCLGRKLAETNALGQTTTWTYDFAGHILTETNSLGEVKTYTYDANGNKLTYTTISGNVLAFTYDTLNRMLTAGDTTGLFESYTYDGVGNKIKTLKANGDVTSTTFTAFNKPAKITDALGNEASYTYDKNYNLIRVEDRLGKATVNTYDKLNRLNKVTDALGNMSFLAFDTVGNMVKMTDAKGNETVYAYDMANRMVSVTYADGTSKAVAYSAAGKIIQKTDQNGTVITYGRDDLYRITQRGYPDTSSNTYTYDKLGRMKTATNAYGTVSFTYDAAGRITVIDQNGTQVTYVHDVSKRTRTLNYPSGKQFVETYTLRDKIHKIDTAVNSTNVVTYTYDALSRPLTKTLGNGVVTGYTYSKNSRITGISYTDGNGTNLLGFQYTYDKNGNRLSSRNTAYSDRSEQYDYDDIQRLTSFKQGQADVSNLIPAPQFTSEYELDPLGNFLTVTRDGTAQSRSVNAMNQYTSVKSVPLVYDANGNLVDDGQKIYQYDYENQLIKITRKSDSTVIAAFTIDALNRRVKKSAGGTTTEYIYDDSRIIEEQVNKATIATYVYGNKLDEVLLMNRGGTDAYFLTDVIGSVMALTDNGGSVTETYQYDAYGQVTFFNAGGTQVFASARENPYLFTGRRYDAGAQVYYYRARCYHPALGRFLNPDPKGFIDGMNLYEYAMSNPLRYVDPRGTAVKTCDSHSFSYDVDNVKKILPKFLSKYMSSGSVSVAYQKCRECCGEGTKNGGEYAVSKELSVSVGWSGDTGYINTPWGISWDIDWYAFQSKGFLGLVAKVSWGISGSLAGGYDGCEEKRYGKGCIKGSITLEALYGVADENKESSLIKAYISGGVTGYVDLCLKIQSMKSSLFTLEASAGLSGAIKGTVGVWKFTYERTFYEVTGYVGPWVIFSL